MCIRDREEGSREICYAEKAIREINQEARIEADFWDSIPSAVFLDGPRGSALLKLEMEEALSMKPVRMKRGLRRRDGRTKGFFSLPFAGAVSYTHLKLPRYSEMSIAIVMSAGVGLAGVLSGFVKNAANFNSFLFGSIVAISDTEMYLVVGVSAAVLLLFLLMYKELFYISLDEQSARLAGVPVRLVNFLFTLLIAVTVSVSARTVGALIVSSMMVVPVACAMQFGRNYRQTILWAVGLDMIFMTTGLFAAYYLGLKPGGAIVLSGVAFLILVFTVKKLLRIFLK